MQADLQIRDTVCFKVSRLHMKDELLATMKSVHGFHNNLVEDRSLLFKTTDANLAILFVNAQITPFSASPDALSCDTYFFRAICITTDRKPLKHHLVRDIRFLVC
jgi:hypothetical protein